MWIKKMEYETENNKFQVVGCDTRCMDSYAQGFRRGVPGMAKPWLMMGEEVGDGVIFDFTMSATFGGIAVAEAESLLAMVYETAAGGRDTPLEPFIVEGSAMAPVPAPKR